MSSQLSQLPLNERHRPMLIIWFAMIMGVVIFGVIAGIQINGEQPADNLPVLTYAAMGMAAMSLVLRLIVPSLIARIQFAQTMKSVKNESNLDEEQLLGILIQIFYVRFIVGMALLEGAAMFVLVSLLVEKQILAYIPVGILLLIMIGSIPTKSKLGAWIRTQMENYNLEKQN